MTKKLYPLLLLLFILNAVYSQNNDTRKSIHYSWNLLLKKYVSPNGNVNYMEWKKQGEEQLDNYLSLLLKNPPQEFWTKGQKLAYWINTYNAFTVKLILDNYPVKSIRDIKNPWKKEIYVNGDKKYSLEDIEHNILRKMDEPRIHFAINCASKSCPKLENKAFTSYNINQELEKVTKDFLKDSSKNNITKDEIALSKIFLWFAEDFGDTNSLLLFIQKYTDTPITKSTKLSYLTYDWDLNE